VGGLNFWVREFGRIDRGGVFATLLDRPEREGDTPPDGGVNPL